MTDYLKKSFTVAQGRSEEGRKNHGRIFAKHAPSVLGNDIPLCHAESGTVNTSKDDPITCTKCLAILGSLP